MPNKTIGLIALLAGFAASELMAGDLTSYATGDVLICFRNGGANDLVVDAGPIGNFTGLAQGQRIAITAYTSDMLHYVSTNSVSWSAFTYTSDNTLYATRARNSFSVQSTPWQAGSSSLQAITAGRIGTIPLGAVDEAAYVPPGEGSSPNTSTAVVEADGTASSGDYTTGESYKDAMNGSFGSAFNGTFRGNPEFTTAANFTKANVNARADFYQMTPTGGIVAGTYLGFFELSTNGSMSYVAYPSTVPSIKSISRHGNINTINYTSGQYGTYTLRSTNNLVSSGAKTNWPAVSTLGSGDSSIRTTTDTTTDTMKFYIITTPQ